MQTEAISTLRALKERKEYRDGLGGPYGSLWETPEEYANYVASHYYGSEAVEKYHHTLTLLSAGDDLHSQGYRLHQTPRQIRGLGFTIPDDAVEWDTWPAGYLATSECERLFWVTKS